MVYTPCVSLQLKKQRKARVYSSRVSILQHSATCARLLVDWDFSAHMMQLHGPHVFKYFETQHSVPNMCFFFYFAGFFVRRTSANTHAHCMHSAFMFSIVFSAYIASVLHGFWFLSHQTHKDIFYVFVDVFRYRIRRQPRSQHDCSNTGSVSEVLPHLSKSL